MLMWEHHTSHCMSRYCLRLWRLLDVLQQCKTKGILLFWTVHLPMKKNTNQSMQVFGKLYASIIYPVPRQNLKHLPQQSKYKCYLSFLTVFSFFLFFTSSKGLLSVLKYLSLLFPEIQTKWNLNNKLEVLLI